MKIHQKNYKTFIIFSKYMFDYCEQLIDVFIKK